MEYSTHVFLQQTPVTEQNFESKLQEISEQITSSGCVCPSVFAPFTNLAVQQAVVSSRHIAFLLQDGRVCRVSFRVQADKIEPAPTETTKSKTKHITPQTIRPPSRPSVHRSNNFDRPSFENLVLSSSNSSIAAHNAAAAVANATNSANPSGQVDLLPQLQPGYSLSRQRHHLIRTARGRTGIIFGSRPMISAASVPEELIEQVQVVLQGKSRNLILRELQRTNLDVNMAVNNLLARDDEGDEDLDDDYVGADLISLLDVNPHNEHPNIILESEFFDEADFALRYSNIQRRVVSARIGNTASTTASGTAAASNSSLGEQANVPNPPTSNASSTSAPSAAVSSSNPASTNTATTTNPLERDRKRNRYDPRWLDGSLREELFGRIDRELKPDDLSLVKDSGSSKASLRKDSTSSNLASQANPPSYQSQQSASANLSSISIPNPIQFGDQLQFWTDPTTDNGYPRFTHLAALHSELVAINVHGQLCQWNWHDDYPYQDPDNIHIKHPKTVALQLFNEKITHLSAHLIRASVLTDTNRLATWIDESLGVQVSQKFQHAAQELPSPIPLQILDIQTSPLFTVVRTATNDLYWYGLLPNKARKKLLERLKEKTRKNRSNNPSQQQQQQQQAITIGASVCLISNPYYNQGALAFYIRDGQPKLGQLMEQAWMLSNTARFRLKPPEINFNKAKEEDKSSMEMPPPPSPASSTCSVDSNTSFASSLKRKKPNNPPASAPVTTTTTAAAAATTTTATAANPFLMNINDNDSNDQQPHSKIKDEEYWPLDEVIFIEDCKVAPIGKVVKIDGSLVLVKFPTKPTNEAAELNLDMSNLDNCRILRKDDLQIVKGNTLHKTPDCTLSLSNAKRISLENGTLLTYSVDKDYLHTLQLRDSTVFYLMYEIGSNNGLGRSIRQNSLPLVNNRQSLASFLGGPMNFNQGNLLRLSTLNSMEIPRLLIDGSHLLYPLVYNQDVTNIREPQWKNLFAVNYFAQGIVPLKHADHLSKSHVLFNIMQIQKGLLIPHILRYDFEKIRSILNEIEATKNRELLRLILDERLDGHRNLFHACVQIAIPLTNREYPISDETMSNETNNINLKRISFAIDSLHSQSNNDHNYGGTNRTGSDSSMQTNPMWSSNTNDSSMNDAQPPSSPTMPSGVTAGLYRSLSMGSSTPATTTNAGSLSPSYTPSSLPSKIQYLQNQLYSQQAGSTATRSSRSNSNDFLVWPSCKYDEREKRIRAIKILRLLLEYPLFQEHLLSLLSFRNLEGQTPFMSAVNARAYHCASILFEYATKTSKRETSIDPPTLSVQFYLDASLPNESRQPENLLLRMIYPLTSNNSDYSPLYTICTNDTCSFTWTGEEHISQAIFECKTCGLSGTLCCCSECAQTCHKGHDCRLKRTSPTAYCDCWEVCKCKSLIAGDQQKRLELFKVLLNQTSLVQVHNSRYENLLLYLVQTVGRQLIEQQQFPRTSTASILQQQARKSREQMANSSSSLGAKKLQHQHSNSSTNNPLDSETNTNIPDHHLEPPQFCRRALELLLADWPGVRSMLLCGCPENIDPTVINPRDPSTILSTNPPILSTYDNEHVFSLDQQQQTSQLDRFTYFLLAKCNTIKQSNSAASKNPSTTSNELLDILLNTLTREMSNPAHRDMARFVTARFVRSVVRLFIILNLESVADKSSSASNQSSASGTTIKRISATTVTGATITTSSNLSSSSSMTGPQIILHQCKRIFQMLTMISIDALVHMADILLAPVRHGIAKPTAMFNLLSNHTDVLQGLDEVFNVDSEYYRAYQESRANVVQPPAESLYGGDLSETELDENIPTISSTLHQPLNMESNDDDDNNSDNESQHETINPTGSLHLNERTTIHESNTGLSDNESEMELELLAESDTDNESNRSAPNTNTHRTSATAGSENMALFSDDENSESDDADSVRSDSVLGEGDETSQPEPMIFEDPRDALAVAAGSSATATATAAAAAAAAAAAGNTSDRLVLLPSGSVVGGSNSQTTNTSASHLSVPRLNLRTSMASTLFGDSHSRRQIAPTTTPAASLNHSTSIQQAQQAQQQQQQSHIQQQQQQQQQASSSSTTPNVISVNTTNAWLSRAFGILLRQITDLLIRWPNTLSATSLYHDVLTTATTIDEQNTLDTIQNEIDQCLLASWQWFATVMDSFESQLRFGMTLSNLSHNENDSTFHGNRFLKNLIDRAQVDSKKKSTTTAMNRLAPAPVPDKPVNHRLDFLNYSLSLMRSTHEHGDQEPTIDVLSHKHLAYLLDAFIYYFRESGFNDSAQASKGNWRDITDETSANANADASANEETINSNHSFFQRSPSTLCLSSLGPDPFQISVDDSLPLACRPQLLQPICRKEDLFGRFLYDKTAARYSHLPSQLGLSHREHSIPDFLQPNYLNLFNSTDDRTTIKTRDDDRMAVDVLLDLSAGLSSSNRKRQDPTTQSMPQHGSYEYLLARWRFSIELFVKLFLDDVGGEAGSIINESSGFSAREQRFRHEMERLKNAHQKDIRFETMERDRTLLIQKTFRTLNTYYFRNHNMSSSSSSIPPLAVQRVKVTFKDEPGEGSGVARSFYASIVEVILSEEKLPVLELGSYGASSASQSTSTSVSSSHAQRQQRPSRERRTTLATYLRSDRRSSSMVLSSDARPFKMPLSSSDGSSTTNTSDSNSQEPWPQSKIRLGVSIYPKVAAIQPFHADKITGMLLESLSTPQLHRMINLDEDLRLKVEEAMNLLSSHSTRETPQNTAANLTNERLLTGKTSLIDKQPTEYAPLFWQPDKKGVYAPRPGKATPERLTAYRNVGRLIGLCLLQNELFPLPLCRHVIKYILNRSIRWHDLAFFDSMMYENLRRTAFDAEKHGPQYVDDLHLTFSVTVTEKEGSETYDLVTDGSSKDVTYSNLYDFIKRYAEFRMISLVEQSLQHLRMGVFDVLPSASLDYLSAEDFRLLLNGTSNINVTTLMTYTTFNDESGETSERINQFKKWFWSVLEKFNAVERQDLVYFWTGSPALPASEAGFQPQPSVTIRPADDQHLPTANTCISRLYVPLYSSKNILKLKLQYAIKTKMFGFV